MTICKFCGQNFGDFIDVMRHCIREHPFDEKDKPKIRKKIIHNRHKMILRKKYGIKK